MSNTATKDDIDEVIDILRGFMQQVSDKFDNIDQKFVSMDQRLGRMEAHLDELDRKHEHLRDA